MKIGIDIGGSHIATGLVIDKGILLDKETRDIEIKDITDGAWIENVIIETIKKEIKNLLERNDYEIEDIYKIGLAVPGCPSKDSLRNLVNLHIKEFNIAEPLKAMYKTEVNIKNDGKCAGIAEKKYGALKEYNDCVFLCMGTGVGSAVFLNNELLEPKKNPGFEFGHMIIQKDGERCNCGNYGCFETLASMKRFKARAIEKLKLNPNIKSQELQDYIRTYRFLSNVREFVDDYISNVCIGLANIINIFEPEAICFGGSFSYYSDIFLPIIEEKIKEMTFNKDNKVEFVCAKLKNDAGIIGATEL